MRSLIKIILNKTECQTFPNQIWIGTYCVTSFSQMFQNSNVLLNRQMNSSHAQCTVYTVHQKFVCENWFRKQEMDKVGWHFSIWWYPRDISFQKRYWQSIIIIFNKLWHNIYIIIYACNAHMQTQQNISFYFDSKFDSDCPNHHWPMVMALIHNIKYSIQIFSQETFAYHSFVSCLYGRRRNESNESLKSNLKKLYQR